MDQCWACAHPLEPISEARLLGNWISPTRLLGWRAQGTEKEDSGQVGESNRYLSIC